MLASAAWARRVQALHASQLVESVAPGTAHAQRPYNQRRARLELTQDSVQMDTSKNTSNKQSTAVSAQASLSAGGQGGMAGTRQV